MKYKDIDWELKIECEGEEVSDSDLEFIAQQISRGYFFGNFTTDCTDYAEIDRLKTKLELHLGRDVDCTYEERGELDDLLDSAEKSRDWDTREIIMELLEQYE